MATGLIETHMAAAVVNVVGNVVVKVIENIWTQPQKSAQHQLRLKELEKQHEYSIIESFNDSKNRINEQQIIENLKATYSISTPG